ncbi:hypothetical protein OROHE_008060 [Orobanche hederae]
MGDKFVDWRAEKGFSPTKLCKVLTEQGFNPLKVHLVTELTGPCGFDGYGYAIVKFERLSDALRLENAYDEAKHKGLGITDKGEELYGWVVGAADYYLDNIVGDCLQREGGLKKNNRVSKGRKY